MKIKLNKNDSQRPSIGVRTAAIRAINAHRVSEGDEVKGRHTIMKQDRGITSSGIISRRDNSMVMKIEAGGGKAAEKGREKDGTDKGQKEVGNDEIDRWKKNREREDETRKRRINLIARRREKGRKTAKVNTEEPQRTRVVKKRDRITERQRRLREREDKAGRKTGMAMRRRMRSGVDEENRGWRNPDKREMGSKAGEKA